MKLTTLVIVLGFLSIGSNRIKAEIREAEKPIDTAVLVSANAEWAVMKLIFPEIKMETSPWGQYFFRDIALPDKSNRRLLVFHGGWGKVAAAGSTQYIIDRWNPSLLVNLGTCGGFAGAVERFAVILARKTIIYDIIERMGSAEEAVADYSSTINLDWLSGNDPKGVLRTVMVSGDQDLDPEAVQALREKYGAVAGDWESGAIAYVAGRNGKRLLILRGVTDLVHRSGGEAYGQIEVFKKNTETVMKRLWADLPDWLARIRR